MEGNSVASAAVDGAAFVPATQGGGSDCPSSARHAGQSGVCFLAMHAQKAGRSGRRPVEGDGTVAKLTPAQLQEFDEQGYLFLPDCFSDEEIAVLRAEAEAIYRTDRQEVWREKSGAPRTAFAAHTYNEAFRHPRRRTRA